MENYHNIKAQLYDNALTENPNDFIARIISERSLNIRSICESAATRGRADISAPAMEHGVNLFLKEMAYNLCDGFSINTGWFTVSPQIKGVFDSPDELFDPNKHSILFEFAQGSLMRKELEKIKVDILGLANSSLSITQVTDMKTGMVNNLITPRHNLKISGFKLKIAGDSPENGVCFINQESMERIPIENSDIIINYPSELIIMIPELREGEYQLEVTTQYGSNTKTFLKKPRTAVFDKLLTVE